MYDRIPKRPQSNGLENQPAPARTSGPSSPAKRGGSSYKAVMQLSSNLRRNRKSAVEIVKQGDAVDEDIEATFLQFWYVGVNLLKHGNVLINTIVQPAKGRLSRRVPAYCTALNRKSSL